MRRLLIGLVALAWAGIVFLLTFWLTFPSDAFVDRIRAEVPDALGAEYSAELASVSPWWIGLSAGDFKLYQTPRRPRPGQEAGTTLVAMAQDVRARVGLFSLISRSPYVSGSATLTEGTVYYEVGTTLEDGGATLNALQIEASDFPLADLMVFLPEGTELAAIGDLDLEIDLESGEEGMSDASGDIDVSGGGITLSEVVVPGVGPLGFDIPITELELSFDVDEGKAEVDVGRAVSPLVTVEVQGMITLRDPIDRSSVDLEFVVSDLGSEFQAFEMMLGSAKHSDGRYHYQCRGMLSRLTSCPVPKREVSSRRRSTPRPRPVPTTSRTPRDPGDRDTEYQRTMSDDERARRREEIRERLRQRREEREAELRGEPEVLEDEELLEEEGYLEDEEFLEDEELLEEEGYLDDEGFED